MNKLIIAMIALCFMSSVVAMDIMTLTKTENSFFVKCVSEAVTFGEKMIAANKIPAKNPIHAIYRNLLSELKRCNEDLLTIIQEKKLGNLIELYTNTIEEKENVQVLRDKIFDQTFDEHATIAPAMMQLIAVRRNHSEAVLQISQPNYSGVLLGGNEDEGKVNFMVTYPTDENFQKNYIAALIYQLTLARRAPYGISDILGFGGLKEVKTI